MSINNGELFQLGNHILACGDSTDKAFVQSVAETAVIRSIISDPPYGVAAVENALNPNDSHKKIKNDHLQTNKEYAGFTHQWLEAMKTNLAPKNNCYIFNSDKMIFALKKGMDQAGFKFAQLLIWAKNHAVVGRLDYLPQHELIAYGWFGTHSFYKAKDKSILYYPKPNKSKLHPTMKPVGLLRRLILNSTEIGDTVYDPFLGSGSTLLAAEQTLRRCIGIELDPEYCQVVIDRFEKLTGQKAKKL